MGGVFGRRAMVKLGEKMSESSIPSTKRLKSMLKMLLEHGVSRYKDANVEIEFGGMPPMIPQMYQDNSQSFSMDRYDPQPSTQPGTQNINPEADNLGFTEEDYLWRSAES